MKMSVKKSAMLAMAIVTALANTSYVSAAASDNEQIKTRDVVVTASRTEQEIKATPASVEVVTADDIKKTGAETLAQALQLTTGINILENGMVGHAVGIRGMKTNQTLILVDGRRIRTENTDQTANAYELERVDMANVERIEIVRGATSSLYGADAMGGVINIITKNHDKEWVNVSADWTTRQNDLGFQASLGKKGKWTTGFGFKWDKVRHINTDSSGTTSMAYKTYGTLPETYSSSTSNMYGDKYFFNFDTKYDINENKNIKLFFDYMKEDLKQNSSSLMKLDMSSAAQAVFNSAPVFKMMPAIYPSNYIGFNKFMQNAGAPLVVDSNYLWTLSDGTPYTTTYNNTRYNIGIEYNGKDKKGDYQLRYTFTDFKKDSDTFNDNTGVKTDFDTIDFQTHNFEGKRTYQLNDKNLLTFGAEIREEKYDSTRVGDNAIVLSGGNLSNKKATEKNMTYWAAYAQDEWTPDDKWLVIPSLRFDHNNTFGDKMTWKVGSTYSMSEQARLKFNVGTSYRAPTATELYMNWTHSPIAGVNVHVIGNPNLKPENAVNFDFGIEAEKGKLSGKATYFINKVNDLIDTKTTSSIYVGYTTSQYQNVDNATIQGFEFESKYKFGNGFTARGIYNYLDARNDDTDQLLTGRARHRVSVQLQYDYEPYGLSTTLWNDWFSGYYYQNDDTNEYEMASAGILNFVVNKKIAKNGSVYFGVNNLLATDSTPLGYSGRLWRAGMNWTF